MPDAILFLGAWLGGWILTVLAWRLVDDRLFGRHGDDPDNLTGQMFVMWPFYAVVLALWLALMLCAIVPIFLIGRCFAKEGSER